MTQKNSSKIISVVHPICCGLDVHKDMVSACLIITAPDGEETFVVPEIVQEFFPVEGIDFFTKSIDGILAYKEKILKNALISKRFQSFIWK